jgi:hypothetical protein
MRMSRTQGQLGIGVLTPGGFSASMNGYTLTGPCLTHFRAAVSVRLKSLATWPADRSPRWHDSAISALNSEANEQQDSHVRLLLYHEWPHSVVLGGPAQPANSSGA